MFVPGFRLGPFEIEAMVGQGGMGEVYRARDTRLDRIVAIKVLTEALGDPEARQRFEREARTIARLDHPNIGAVHDVGRVDDTHYLVLEYLSGETLAQRLQRGAMLVSDALRVAFEIAAALEAAHRQQIVHRDLKPGNVMLTKSGAKLLDFGLAKPLGVLAGATNASRLETMSAPITERGTILGTLRYMAPEQVEGRDADARTDVFAFGAMLYEMVTGRPAFAGGSQASIIAGILERDPEPMAVHQPLTPAVLAQVVRGCLEKDPDRRWQSIHDVSSALRLVETSSTTTASAVVSRPRRSWRSAAAIAAGLALAALAVAGMTLWWSTAPPAAVAAPVRFEVTTPPTLSPRQGLSSFALSADGSTMVHIGVIDGSPRLYLRRLSDTASVAIPGIDPVAQVHIAPDGREIVFIPQGPNQLLRRLSLDGGAPTIVGFAGFGALRGLSWGDDGSLIFSRGTDSGLWRLAPDNREPVRITQPEMAKGERSHRWPYLLPGGRAVLYTLANSEIVSFDDATIAVYRFDTGQSKELIHGGSYPVYSPTGHLLYARGGTVLAAPFDLERLEVTGPSVTILNDVVTYPGTGAAQFAISKTGVLASMRGGATQDSSSVVRIDRSGRVIPLAFAKGQYNGLSVSPTSDAIALDIDNANASIWVGDFSSATARRLTLAWSNNGPVWTPDGSRVAFISQRGGDLNIFWQSLESTTAEQLTTDTNDQSVPSFSPDGRYMTFDNRNQGANTRDIHIMDLRDGRRVHPLIATSFDENGARISPDGRWIAYRSDESGTGEIYVQSFPELRRKTLVSRGGNPTVVVWSKKTGGELFYARGDLTVMSVAMSTGPEPTFGVPVPLFRLADRPVFDVTRDGDFVAIQDDIALKALPIQITINWPFLLAGTKQQQR
jgi:eukaryotic-like serine/threonine-protein kinase